MTRSIRMLLVAVAATLLTLAGAILIPARAAEPAAVTLAGKPVACAVPPKVPQVLFVPGIDPPGVCVNQLGG